MTIGLNIAKSVFQAHGVDPVIRGAICPASDMRPLDRRMNGASGLKG